MTLTLTALPGMPSASTAKPWAGGCAFFEIAVPGRWRITVEGGAEVAAWG